MPIKQLFKQPRVKCAYSLRDLFYPGQYGGGWLSFVRSMFDPSTTQIWASAFFISCDYKNLIDLSTSRFIWFKHCLLRRLGDLTPSRRCISLRTIVDHRRQRIFHFRSVLIGDRCTRRGSVGARRWGTGMGYRHNNLRVQYRTGSHSGVPYDVQTPKRPGLGVRWCATKRGVRTAANTVLTLIITESIPSRFSVLRSIQI